MATNEQIKLDIVSSFDPGGFAKANNSVRGLGNEMKKGAKVTDQLMTAFGQADGAMGQMAGTVSKLGAAFKGGGIFALAAAGVALVASKLMEARESAIKFAEEQKKIWRDDYFKKNEDTLTALKTKHSQIADEMERGAKAADQIAKAYEALAKSEVAVVSSEANKEIAVLEGKKQDKLSGENDPVKRKAIELDFERQILTVKEKAAKAEREQKSSAAATKVTDAESALKRENDKLEKLRSRAEDLKTFIKSDTLQDYEKINPAPSKESFNRTITRGGGVMGIGGGEQSFFDSEGYEKASAGWSTKALEFAKRIAETKKKAQEELSQVQVEMKDAPSRIKAREVEIDEAKNMKRAVSSSNDEAVIRESTQQKSLSEKQIQFEKAQEEYQKVLDKRTKVEERITKQEEKIEKLKDKERTREDKQKIWNQNAQQAQSLGASGWNQQKMGEADDEKQLGKANKREEKWVDEAKKRIARGTKLSDKDMARLANFDDWKKLQGANPFDPGIAAKNQLKAMNDNLKELQNLRNDILNAMKVQ